MCGNHLFCCVLDKGRLYTVYPSFEIFQILIKSNSETFYKYILFN